MTLIIDTSTHKIKFSSVKVNSTSKTLLFDGGSDSVDVSTSTVVVQKFVIIHTTDAANPWKVFTSVSFY